ncbi:hypothetical protein GEMRC1_011851 [Eukaryota sp. GEM-RC1]
MSASHGEVAVEMSTMNPMHVDGDTAVQLAKKQEKDPKIQHRQDAMDILRGIAVMLMVLQHTVIYMATVEVESSWLIRWVLVGPGDVAVMFMFIFGINMANPNSISNKALALRGLKIWVLAACLNATRASAPFFVSCKLRDFCVERTYLEMFLRLDIYHFVGGFILYVALLRSLDMTKWAQLTVTAILWFVFSLFEGTPPNDHTGWFGYYIIGTEAYANFPFRNWMIFPMVGMVLGHYWRPFEKQEVPMKKILYVSLAGWVLLFIALIIYYPELDYYGNYADMNYLQQTPLTNIFFLCQNVLLLVAVEFVVSKGLVWKPFFKFIKFWSRNIMAIFVVSWLLITWISLVVIGGMGKAETIWENYLYMIGAVLLTDSIVRYIPGISKGLKKLIK